MIPKKTRETLISGDENERRTALDSIKKVDSQDIDFLVQTAWSFDQGYLQGVVQKIARVKNQKSASAISTILFACTDKSQEPIRIRCLDALSENPTDVATKVLMNVASNQRFYETQCRAVKKLGSRKKGTDVLALLHEIIKEEKYLPSSERAKQQPHVLVLSAFEALSSESLRNHESALVILDKITEPLNEGVYREQGVKHLAMMGLDSLVDPLLDKIEEHEADRKLVYPLLRVVKELKHTKRQRDRIHRLLERILPTIDQNQPLNNDLVSIMKVTLDEDLIDIVSTVSCNWQLNSPAVFPIIEILNACPKTSAKTIDALLRYAGTVHWNANKDRVLPNLNDCYSERPIDVIRKTFENENPTYAQCRDYLRTQQNTEEKRESLVANIAESLKVFVSECDEEDERLPRYLPTYFNELQTVLVPPFKSEISNEAWRICTRICLYPLIKVSSETAGRKRELLGDGLRSLISGFLSNPHTSQEFVDRMADDWLSGRHRTPSKYILSEGCTFEEHRASIIQTLILRASDYFYKSSEATKNEIRFQQWVSEDIVGRWKRDSKGFLEQCLTQDDVFNEWAYDTLREHDLLDCSIVVRGLTSKISDLYTMRLLEDLIPRYSADAENILVQKIRHGRPARIRASGTTAAGAIFDYDVNPNCPNTVLGAVHERFSEQSREVREAAYVSLGKICSAESIDVLQKAKAKDTKLESVIKQSLDNIFARFSEAKPSEDNVDTTIAWIKVIGKLADKRGFEKLKPYVDPESYHRDEAVRIAAVAAMGFVGTSEHIAFLEELRQKESHFPELTREIDRTIGFISNIGDFKLLDVVRQLTDDDPAFSDPTLDLSTIFGKRAQSIKNHCFQAYKAWNSQDYSLYVTQLDNVCDLLGKTIIDVFRNELFGGNEKRYVSVKTSDSPENRYNLIKGKFDSVTGSCFIIIHALRVKAPIAHPEDSKTEQPKRELSSDEGELAKENFINAVTKSVEKLRDKVLPTHGHATF